ncbi:MAG TPA: wax ester/triacylglycerol synthase family O-acyltransferase [Marmoricola sp.]|jgi:WS/DGAT/MGAT family acyltransferase|nr:wax ester/triacylglycerol synthase family O-acyltransferase [Marmoricola sp.]
MPNMPLDDAMFLLGEAPGKPAHVIALQLFKPAPDVGPDHLATAYADLLALEVKRTFRKRAVRRALSPTTLEWADDGMDLDYHVRHTALPPPGRVRELLEVVSLQHGVSLDRNRPLWEYHLIGGLADGRFATAFKTHHALADGMTLAKHVLDGLSPDPAARDCTPPWALSSRPSAPRSARHRTRRTPTSLPVLVADAVMGSARSTFAAARTLQQMALDADATVPYAAPNSVLNSGISGARRFAGDKWEHSRLKAVASAAGSTVNDVVLAVCGGALRAYLIELDALPDRSLVAMVPISLRRDAESFSGEGNSFGAILTDLRTHEQDPLDRLDAVTRSTVAAKARMNALTPAEASAVSKAIMGGAALGAILGITGTPRQPFNLIISNVPATPHPLYSNGAELTDIYPISMISEGQAMNITVSQYAGSVMFGIVGDRAALPRLQRMLIHLDNALSDLEKATS